MSSVAALPNTLYMAMLLESFPEVEPEDAVAPVGFLPIFASEADAMAWRQDEQYEVYQVQAAEVGA